MTEKILNKAAELSNEALDAICEMDLPLPVREYILANSTAFIHNYLPDQNSSEFSQELMTKAVNTCMKDLYDGKIESTQVLASGDKEFLQSPAMLSYWAKSKGFETIEQNNNTETSGKMVLTYYPPLAKSYANREKGVVEDQTNKHFYSHCKSSLVNGDASVSVINPELFYNSDISERKYAPEDAVLYNVDYQKLGLDKETVEEGFKFMAADINIMDPEAQKEIFALKDQGLSTDEIIKKCAGKYTYNLQEYNCAVKPVAPLVYANEAKIRAEQKKDKNYDADDCRRNLGLPNIYDNARYEQINKEFYVAYMDDAKQNFMTTVKHELKKDIKIAAKTADTALKIAAPLQYGIPSMVAEHAVEYLPEAQKKAEEITQTVSDACDKYSEKAQKKYKQGKKIVKDAYNWISDKVCGR